MVNQHYDTVIDPTAGSAYRRTLNKAFTIGIDVLLSMRPRAGGKSGFIAQELALVWPHVSEQIEGLR